MYNASLIPLYIVLMEIIAYIHHCIKICKNGMIHTGINADNSLEIHFKWVNIRDE